MSIKLFNKQGDIVPLFYSWSREKFRRQRMYYKMKCLITMLRTTICKARWGTAIQMPQKDYCKNNFPT